MSLSLRFARRYYNASFENKYIRFINRASKIGISVGVAALILGLSIMNGFERELKNTLLAVMPDIEYESVKGKLPNWQTTSDIILADPSVKAAAPYIKLNAMVQKQTQLEAVILHGAQPELEKGVNKTYQYIAQGSWLISDGNNSSAVIGSGLAEKLNLTVGDKLELLVPNDGQQGKLLSPKYLSVEVVGIYQIGGQMDHGQVFVKLDRLQQLFGWQPQETKGVKVALNDPFDARRVVGRIGNQLTDYVYMLDWFRSQGHVYNDIVMVKDIMYLVMVLVMAVACFNIVSSLTMAVQEKHGDIGILKTMGLTPKTVQRIFVLMGMLTAIKGIAWGLVWGVLLAWYLPELFAGLESLFNFKALDSDVYFINHLPSELLTSQVLVVSLTAFVIAFLATLYPAKRAAKLTPVELLG